MLSKAIKLILVCIILKFAPKVWASDNHILINEIMYDAVGSDTGYEWIELYNPGEVSVELTGWVIEVAGTDWTTVVQFEEELSVEAKGYFLICGAQVEGCDFYVDKIGMQNGGSATDGVRITDGNIQDTILYDSPNVNGLLNDRGIVELDENTTKPVNNSDESLCRISSNDTNISSEDFVICEKSTPGEENQTDFDEIISIEEIKLRGKGIVVGLLIYCDDEQECILVDNTGGLKIGNSSEVSLENDRYYKLHLEEKDKVYQIKEIIGDTDIEKFELEHKDLELVEDNLYRLIRKEVELIYTDEDYYYFKTTKGSVFRVNKVNIGNIDSDWKYELSGVLDFYSIGADEEYKYEMIPMEVTELEKIEVEVNLAESGSGILVFFSLAVFLILVLNSAHRKSYFL